MPARRFLEGGETTWYLRGRASRLAQRFLACGQRGAAVGRVHVHPYPVGLRHLGDARHAAHTLHFDVAHRNCPEYANITALKDMLRKRLETVTNKPKKA